MPDDWDMQEELLHQHWREAREAQRQWEADGDYIAHAPQSELFPEVEEPRPLVRASLPWHTRLARKARRVWRWWFGYSRGK